MPNDYIVGVNVGTIPFDFQDEGGRSEISDLKSALDKAESIIGTPIEEWEQGSINATTYENVEATTRARTEGYIEANSIQVNLPDGMKLRCFYYNSSKVGIGKNSLTSGKMFSLSNPDATYIRLIVGYDDDRTITDAEALKQSITIFKVDNSLGSTEFYDSYKATLNSGYVVNSSGTIGSINSGDYFYTIMPVFKGEKYLISGKGGSDARLWSLHDYNKDTTRVADSMLTLTTPVTLTIADNEKYLVFNSQLTQNVICERIKGDAADLQLVKDSVVNSDIILNTFKKTLSQPTLELGYYKNNASPMATTTTSGIYRGVLISVTEGETYEICGYGSNAARLWATSTGASGSYTIKRVADENANSLSNPLILTIREGEEYLTFNTRESAADRSYIRKVSVTKGLYDYAHENIEQLKIGQSTSSETRFNVGNLDVNFETKIPCEVTGTKGNKDASYAFSLLLGNKFNIRAKFRIADKIINSSAQSYDIVSFDNVKAYATTNGLSQYSRIMSIDGVSTTVYFPTLDGGITFNGLETSVQNRNLNIGDYAFSVKYTGNNGTASIQATATALVLTDFSSHTFTLANYDTMQDLFDAVSELTDYDIVYNSLEGHTPDELAVFSAVSLINQAYVNGEMVSTKAPFFVPYAIDPKWHQIEIVGISNTIYSVIDGITKSYTRNFTTQDIQTIVFGGSCGVYFKDVSFDIVSTNGAELVTPIEESARIISDVNPYIIIYEGHGMDTVPTADETSEMSISSDRIQLLADVAKAKGYIPVSMEDIIAFYDGKRELPKRCYTIIFDDYQFANYLNFKNRSAFTRNGITPSLAVITSDSHPITYNGNTITIEKAIAIGRNCGFSFFSHTKNHADLETVNPENLMTTLAEILTDADEKDVDGNVIVYPYGHTNRYITDTMKFMGFKAGVNVNRVTYQTNRNCNKYNLIRREIGVRESTQSFLGNLV